MLASQADDRDETRADPTRRAGERVVVGNPWLTNAILAIAYFGAAQVSLLFAFPELKVTVIWIPSGIALAAVLAYGERVLPGLAIGDLAAGLYYGSSPVAAVCIACAGVLEAVLGARLITMGARTGPRPPLISTGQITKFVVYGAVIAPIVPSFMGAAALWYSGTVAGNEYPRAVAAWWTGDVVGVLLAMPLVLLALTWGRQDFLRSHWDGLLVLAVLALSCFIFSRPAQSAGASHSLVYLLFPLIVWCAFALSAMLLAVTNILAAAVALAGTRWHHGPYAAAGDVTDIWYLQAFIAALVLTSCMVRGAISDRRRAERRVVEAEGHFQAAADHGAFLLFILRSEPGRDAEVTDWIIAYANRQARARLQVAPSSRVTARLKEVLPALDNDAFRGGMRRVQGEFASFESEVALPDAAGREQWFRLTAIPVAGGIMIMMLDITEQRRAEAALRESEAQFRTMVNLSPDAITIHQGGRWVFANDAAARLLGVAGADQLVGRSLLEFMHPDIHESVKLRWKRLYEDKLSVDPAELRMTRDDGSQIYLETRASPIQWKGLPAAEVVARDMTDRRRAEQALRDYAQRLSSLSRRLMDAEESERRNVNRELHDRVGQNLSVAAVGLSAVRAALGAEGHAALLAQIEGLERLIQQTNTRIRNVMAELHPPALEEFGLLAALRTYANDQRVAGSARVSVTGVAPAPRLPRAVEMGLFRICQEAVNNALKHARAQEIDVHLAQRGGTVEVTVSDDGAGISPDGGNAPSASWGMTIMRERAEALGARLRMASGVNRGTLVLVQVDWSDQ